MHKISALSLVNLHDTNFALYLKEEEEEDLNDREVDDEDDEGEQNSILHVSSLFVNFSYLNVPYGFIHMLSSMHNLWADASL